MSRSVKESEDEMEMKIGRRLRASGSTSVVDSPLRRSTRNKQPINQDDGSSPESITSDTTGPPMRNTKRKTATMEYFSSDNTRSLRPRKNSTASDTTDYTDGDASKDMKKRITRRSVATVPSVETPTKTRLRRSMRAGSESNTASPSIRATRRTRASSVDFDDSNEAHKDKSMLLHLHTPLKTRNRASALPSEPSVVEESDSLPRDEQDCSGGDDDDDSRNKNTSGHPQVDNIRSPLLRLNHDDKNEMNGDRDEDDINVMESTTLSIKLCDNVSESPSNDLSKSSKLKTELKGKLISEIDLPKVVLYKADFPITRNPKNKENEESQTFTADDNSKSSNPNIISQRRSTNFLLSKKVQVKPGLNRSMDSNLLTNIDCQTVSESPSPLSGLARSRASTTSINYNSSATTNIASETNDLKNDSIIIIEEKREIDKDKEALNNDVDNETIHIDPQLQDESFKNISEEQRMNDSVMEIDTTADNYLDDGTVNNKSNVFDSSSKVTEVVEESYLTEANLSQNMVEKNIIVCSSMSIPLNTTGDIRPAESLVETIEASNTITSGDSMNNSPTRFESVVETTEDNNENKDSTSYNEYQSQPDENKSASEEFRPATSPNKTEKDDGNNVKDDENVETNVENLFQDILADEWKTDRTEQTITDECVVPENIEYDTTNNQNVASSNRESLRGMLASSRSKIVETSENDSDDTVIMQTTNAKLQKSVTASQATLSEDNMNVISHDDDTEIEQEKKSDKPSRKKSLPKNQNSPTEKLSKNIEVNGKYTNGNEFQRDALLRSKSRKNSIDSKSSDSVSRRSLNINSSDSNQESRMRRRTIEKMNSVKYHQSREQSIPTESSPMDVDEDTNCDEETLNEMVGEKSATKKSIDGETDRDSVHHGLDTSVVRKMDAGECKLKKDHSGPIETNSTSDSDSNNESNQSTLMPEFIFNVSTSEEDSNDDDSASIDSDIERELNLNGDSISKYSDDNVAGDECRASETENSDDDDDDEDDDMADFIVDDDEDVEEDESSEENVSDDDEDSIELELKENTSYKTQSNESANTDDNHSSTKAESLESSSNDEEERASETNESLAIMGTKSCQKLSPKTHITAMSMGTSTPEIRRKSAGSKMVTTPEAKSVKTPTTDKNTPIPASAEVMAKSMHKSAEIVKTPAKKLNNSKLQNTPTDIYSPKNPARSESFKQKKSKSLSDEPINHSMQIAPIESPEVKQLMSEKLNASLPTLKLQGRILKVSRRSSLLDVKEAADERNDRPSAESTMERINCSENKTKKKKKTPADQTAEDLEIVKPNAVSGINNENIVKKKKKSSNTETNTLVSEEEIPKKKKSNKQKGEVSIDRNSVDTEPPFRKKSKRTAELETQSVMMKENARDNNIMVAMKNTRKNTSRDGSMKSRENKPLKLSATSENAIPLRMPNIKRLPEDLLENLSDSQVQPKKRIKLDNRNLPSRTMFDSKETPDNLSIDDVGYISVSACGGTSQFSVVNLNKINAKRSKKSVAAMSFRERILQRNVRQPISAYLMYQQKLKASGKDKR